MEKGGKKLIVSAIENGTVFDHIPANQLFKVISILGLQDCQNQGHSVQTWTASYWAKKPS